MPQDDRYSRRGFLGRVGAGTLAAAGAGSGLAGALAPVATAQELAAGGFGRMFSLPPFAQPSRRLEAALLELGARLGPMDARDDYAQGPENLFHETYVTVDDTNYRFSGDKTNPSAVGSEAGTTFLAQFVAHDVTFDATSPLGRPAVPARVLNARTPRFDLESIYGGGAALAPHLYESDSPARLVVENIGRYEDVPRRDNGTALMGDVRNDQTVVLCGLHAAFLLFHNRVLDAVEPGLSPQAAFERARRETRWHYQWLILNEFLPKVAGPAVVADVLRRGRRYFRPTRPFVPVEFAGAVFRFGHSMVRPSYRLNFTGRGGRELFAMTFDPAESAKARPGDLRGGFRAPERHVDWNSFFDFGDGLVGPSKRIDTRISTPLFELPLGAIPTRQAPVSLPQRDLLRHVTWQLPSGQAVARKLGVRPLAARHFNSLRAVDPSLQGSTPLWYYVLEESAVREGGRRLGPVGARIAAEVVIGLLQLDPESYLRAQPSWKPAFGNGRFGIAELLRAAGVDPASRAA